MKKIILVFFLLGICCPLAGVFAQDKIIAVVNKEVITQSDLDNYLKFIKMELAGQYRGADLQDKIAQEAPHIVEKLIEDRLIVQEAKKENMQVDENRIKARIEEMRGQYPSEKDFMQDVISHGLTMADMESKIRDQLLMFEVVEAKIKDKIRINPKEITDFYAGHKDELAAPALRHILSVASDNEMQAGKLFYDLKKGTDFRQAVASCGLTVDDLGKIKPGQLTKELDQVISVLAAGEFSDVVKFDNKFYIFKLEEMSEPRIRPFEEAKQEIYNYIFQQKMQSELTKWLEALKAKAYIEIK